MTEVEDRDEGFVTVCRYRDLSEAIVAKSLLESAEIDAWIRDENLARLEWQYSNLLGGIRLQVKTEDEAAAREILQQPIPETIGFGRDEDFAQPRCPACGSLQISFLGEDRRAALASVTLLSLPLPQGGTSWTCHACGVRWRNSEDEVWEPGREAAPEHRESGGAGQAPGFVRAALPILAAMAMLYVASLADYGRVLHAGAAALSGVVLWLGRRWMGTRTVTRWIRNFLGICAVFFAVLGAFGFGLSFVWAWLPVLLLLAAGMIYDLFVEQPHKGRFARARAERRGLPE